MYLDLRAITHEWLCEDQETTDWHCLLEQIAFSKLHHFSWNIFPTNTMAHDTIPHD